DHVTVKATGCMKRCKEGANLVMPDKSRHSRVRPREVAALVERHFPSQLASQPAPESNLESNLESKSMAIEVGRV
ncbi:MAG TPA: (2Fe-2S) ferredoxin domain-containing protein, partial [Coleofasciculaceae cyanobacterium]